jgi:peptidoglycan-associated lipoprotein
MTPQERATLNDRLARLEDAMFDFNKSVIRSDAQNALKDDVAVIREILANYPNQKLLVEGHCDERGSDEYNMALGDQRAHSAEEFLVTMGIPNAQLTLISYGKDRPVCTDSTEACWQRNRRAHRLRRLNRAAAFPPWIFTLSCRSTSTSFRFLCPEGGFFRPAAPAAHWFHRWLFRHW